MRYALYDPASGRHLTTMTYETYAEAELDLDPRFTDVSIVEILDLGRGEVLGLGKGDVRQPPHVTGPSQDPGQVAFPWKCTECGGVVDHSYAALADVGTPICSKCDCDMELVTESATGHPRWRSKGKARKMPRQRKERS